MTDIVLWLQGIHDQRRRAFGEDGLKGSRHGEAADEIKRLRAENDRLRATLLSSADIIDPPSDDRPTLNPRVVAANMRRAADAGLPTAADVRGLLNQDQS